MLSCANFGEKKLTFKEIRMVCKIEWPLVPFLLVNNPYVVLENWKIVVVLRLTMVKFMRRLTVLEPKPAIY